MDLKILQAIIGAGKMYNDFSPELVKARDDAYRLTKEYNDSYGQPPPERAAILKKLLQQIGENVHFEPTFRCEFGIHICIGHHFYANCDCVMLDGGGIIIGNQVMFGPRVSIYTSNHAIDAQERAAGGCYAKPVVIGNNVWVGGGTTINPDVTIGDNTVIGSGSVVTKDIPPQVIAAGVPCKVIREITDADKTGFQGNPQFVKPT